MPEPIKVSILLNGESVRVGEKKPPICNIIYTDAVKPGQYFMVATHDPMIQFFSDCLKWQADHRAQEAVLARAAKVKEGGGGV